MEIPHGFREKQMDSLGLAESICFLKYKLTIEYLKSQEFKIVASPRFEGGWI